nr:MAG TPA: hypothetical protein [Caudoviricetes sp.]
MAHNREEEQKCSNFILSLFFCDIVRHTSD